MNKVPVAIALERQIPEHIREEYSTFVQFVKAYYEFLEQTQERNLEDLRSLDNTLDDFVFKFKKELSALFPSSSLEDERFLLQRIREFYRSRGSEESFKFLFRAFFNKDAELYYPSKQILRASAGQWIQEKSIFVKAENDTEKSLFDANGKIITIITSRKHINVYCPRVRLYRNGIYEVFIDRSYINDISVGEVVQINGVSYGTILPCPSKYTIIKKGSGFSVGSIYSLPSSQGEGSIVKVTKVNSAGGIEKIQVISFGLDYQTTFFAKLSNSYYQPLEYFHPVSFANIDETSPPSGFSNRDGLFPSVDFNRTSGFYGDTTTGFLDYGYVIKNDYFAYQPGYTGADLVIDTDPYFGQGDYVGQVIGEFYTNALNSVIIDESIAEIMIDLGSVAVYPGYYNSTDGFISDEIYIQDGKYYQLFSYVVRVEQQLDSYVDLVKSLLHPAGYELFAQYNIKNDFIVSSVPLDAFIRYQYFDIQYITDQDTEMLTHLYKNHSVSTPDVTPFNQDFSSPSVIEKYSQLLTVDSFGSTTLNTLLPAGTSTTATAVSHPYLLEATKIDGTFTRQIQIGNSVSISGISYGVVDRTVDISGYLNSITVNAAINPVSGTIISVPYSSQDLSQISYFNHFVIPTEINRNQSQTVSLKNNWDIVLGNQNSSLGTVAPLVAENISLGENFSDRDIGDADTLAFTHNPSVSLHTIVTSDTLAPSGYPTNIKLYSVALTVASDESYTIGTLTGTDGRFSDYYSANERYVGGAIRSSNGLEWSFAGDAWKDSVSNYAYFDQALSNAVVNGVPSPYDFKDRTLTSSQTDQFSSTDYFNRADAASGSITYDRSIIPLEAVSVTFAETLFNTPILGKTDSFALTDPPPVISFGKYKQPELYGYSATLVAGSRQVTLTTGTVFNTSIGLRPIKISGTGAFGANAVLDSYDSINGTFTVNVAHATSGSIIFYIEASSTEPEITDLANTVTVSHSGLNWAFEGDAFRNPANTSDSFSQIISYDRSTTPLEATSVTASHGGLGWELSPAATGAGQNFVNSSDIVNLKQTTTAFSDNFTPSHSALSWDLRGDTFNESTSQINTGGTRNEMFIGVGDFILTPTAATVMGYVANTQSTSGLTGAAEILGSIFLSRYSTVISPSDGFANPSKFVAGSLIGDLSGNNAINGLDGTLINDIFYNTIDIQNYGSLIDSKENVKSRYRRLLGVISRLPSSTINAFQAAGYLTSTASISTSKSLTESINTNSSGTLYFNPYNSFDYNTSTNQVVDPVFSYAAGDYFESSTSAFKRTLT